MASVNNEEKQNQIGHRREASLNSFIQNEEFQRAVVSYQYEPDLAEEYKKLGRLLDDYSGKLEAEFGEQSTKTQQTLKHLTPKYQEKYADLKMRVLIWKSHREELIRKLNSHINRLDRTSKISTAVRLVASTIDASATAGSFWYPDHSWASPAAHVATGCAFAGLFCTVYEVDNSKRLLDDMYSSIEEDLRLLGPVVSWFEKETADLDLELMSIVPDGVHDDILKEVRSDSMEENFSKDECLMMIMRAALCSSARKDESKMEDKDFLHSLRVFSQSDMALYWWNKILFRKHPIDLDYSRMSLEFGQLQSLVMKCIPTLPLEQQRLASMPVAGRVILNFLTMYDSFTELRKGAKSSYSYKLRKYVKKIETELKAINRCVKRMEPQNEKPLLVSTQNYISNTGRSTSV